MYYDTAYEIWKDLKDRYGQTSSAQLYSLQEQMFNIEQIECEYCIIFYKNQVSMG